MLYRIPSALVTPLLAASLTLPFAAAGQSQDPQSQSQSVADAARAARTRKNNPPAQPKVITNDDLDLRSFKPSSSGIPIGSAPKLDAEPPSPAAVARAEAPDKAAAATEAQLARVDPELARLQEKFDLAKKQLEILQRESALDQDTYYSKPDFAGDTAGKAKLDAEQQQINEKQQEVDRVAAELEALKQQRGQTDAGQSASPPDQAKAPAPKAAPAPAQPAPPSDNPPPPRPQP